MLIDDHIAALIVNNTEIFKNIHPNVLTICSYILNVIIFNILGQSTLSIPLLVLALIARFLTDILDGAVARKYNKVTVLGGVLDTFGDVMFILIMLWYILKKTGGPMIILPVFTIIMALYIWKEGTLHDHSNLKDPNGNLIKFCLAHCINNTWCLFTVFFLLILYLH